jgi:hypothetical protein
MRAEYQEQNSRETRSVIVKVRLFFENQFTPSFRDAPLGAGPESITTIVIMDSLMCNCTS